MMESLDRLENKKNVWKELPSIKEILRIGDLFARKNFGQNFLCDQSLCDKLASFIEPIERGGLLEIGPGPGGLTRSLLARHTIGMVAIEKDSRFVEALTSLEALVYPRLKIVHGDALHQDLSLLLPDEPRYLQANLPFNVATPLLIDLLQHFDQWQAWVLMVQKEVGERLLANPRSKAYGRLSVLTQGLCKVESLMVVKSTAFYPEPKVDTLVIKVTPNKGLFLPDFSSRWQMVNDLLRIGFGERRKKLARVLEKRGGIDADMIRRVGISQDARADSVSVGTYWDLARLLCESKTALRK